MADEEIVQKHAKKAYNIFRTPAKHWKQKFNEIALEIIIIIFAVTVSIWLHNWSEKVKDRHEEKEFLRSLYNDLRDDRAEMIADRKGFNEVLQGIHYFERVGAGLNLNRDSLKAYQWCFFGSAQISPRIGRYEALKGSGRLNIVENRELLKNITELYQKIFPLIELKNQRFNSLRETYVTPYLNDHLQLDSTSEGVNWQDLIRT